MSWLKSASLLRGGLFLIKNSENSIIANNQQALRASNLQMLSSRTFRIAALAATLSSSYYGYTTYTKYNKSIRNMSGVHLKPETKQLSSLPPIKPTSVITGPTKLNFDLTLFQYCSCPFCCKTRTLLNYFGLNYNIVEVNPVMRQQLKWSQQYKKVPILLAHTKVPSDKFPDQQEDKVYQINDSSIIASSLGSFLMSKLKISNKEKGDDHRTIDDLAQILSNYQAIDVEDVDGKVKSEVPNKYFLMLGDIKDMELKSREQNLGEEREWREWTDRVLVHSLSPNIYRTLPESIQAFNNFSVMGQWEKHFSTFERMTAVYMGSSVMWLVGRRLKKKYNLKGDVRESLYDNCRQWTKAIGASRKFMGGDKPNLADLSVFGVLSSIEGCTAFNDMLKNTNIGPWYFAVKECCDNHAGKDLIRSI